MGLKSTPVRRWQAGSDPAAQDRFEGSGAPSPTAPEARMPAARYEIRVMALDSQGEVASLDFRAMLEEPSRHSKSSQAFLPWSIRREEIEHYASDAPPAGDRRVMPKDHSVQVEAMELSLCTGPSQRFFEQLSQIGQVEDFRLVGLMPGSPADLDGELRSKGYQNYTLHGSGAVYSWLEDSSESLEDGARLMAASLPITSSELQEVLQAGRRRRLGELAEALEGDYQGAVNAAGSQQLAAAQALVHGQPVRRGQTYLEGGNLLSGRRADGSPYVLVGADTLEIARFQLSKPGREASLLEARAAVAADLGVAVEQLHSVEQPGAFHLDMRMMPVGPGQIALQDSREAVALHLEWLKQEGGMSQTQLERVAEKLESWASQRAPLEDRAARDLQAAGLRVHRLAGVFPGIYDRDRDAVNFFNSRHGVSPQGIRYSILMGGPAQAENYFASRLLEQIQAPIDRLYFLDPSQTAPSLKMMGGLKCRSKLLGRLVARQVASELTAGPASGGPQLALDLV